MEAKFVRNVPSKPDSFGCMSIMSKISEALQTRIILVDWIVTYNMYVWFMFKSLI